MANAQISVLESLIRRVRDGSVLSDDDVRRELEMVGLRERTTLTETEEERLERTKDVTWREALFGRKSDRTPEQEENRAVEEWSNSEHLSRDLGTDVQSSESRQKLVRPSTLPHPTPPKRHQRFERA